MEEVKEDKVTLMLETAAERYDVKYDTLLRACTRRKIKATKFGKRWYVEVAEMDRLFRGVNAAPARSIRASRYPIK